MNIKQQNFAVAALETPEFFSRSTRVAVSAFTISNMHDNRRETVRVLGKPTFNKRSRLSEGFAHGRSAVRNRLKPNRKAHGLLHKATCAVRNLLCALFHTSRAVP